ncbi:MAG: molybdopterin-dependent oxidoreductase [Granulosicoccus sp.]|nr:molybdopterin-dependent oxidoreductase [Granulosicoccus sp.]
MITAFRVNGDEVSVDIDPLTRLSDVLRDTLGLTGTKVGCNAGDCGACTVLVEGAPLCSCLTAVAQVEGCQVETVEGLAQNQQLGNLQRRFLQTGAAQCGICTPGMLMSAQALLNETPRPTREQVEDALGGVLCRCTGYRKIVDAVLQAADSGLETLRPAAGNSVGAAIEHLDGRAKVLGDLSYGADVIPENALVVRVIRSPYHSAKFTIGDKQGFVGAHTGVACLLDASDIPGRNCFGVIPPFADQPVFAEGVARYRGEAVAAIVAERDIIDKFADEDFPVEWTETNSVLTSAEAAVQQAVEVHDERQENVLVRGYVARGDVDANVSKAAHTVTVSTSTPFIEHSYIELEAGYAQRVGDRIEIFGCTQAAQMDREALAEIMALEMSAVRVMPSACGGGFGSKLDISFQPYVALAAWYTGRPALISYSRAESMQSTTKRHPSQITLKVTCDETGRLNTFDFDGAFNTGAYASWGPTVANRVPVHASGPYYVPHYRAHSVALHTHTPPAGAFRGFGVPQSAVAQETAFDELAECVGMDRLEFRLLNALQNGQSTPTGQVFKKGVGIGECLQSLQSAWSGALELAEKFNQTAAESPLRKGVGIASCWYGCGNTSLPNPSTIRFGITPAGRIVLHQGAMDIGQGSNTVITQIAADALGVPVHTIELIDGDTDLTPDCGKTSASRQTYVTGAAAKKSGEALRKTLVRQLLQSDDIDDGHCNLVVEDGSLTITVGQPGSNQTRSIELDTLEPNEYGYVFMAEETYDPPTQPLDEMGQGVPYAVYGYGAQMMELTVDITLGTVKLDKITCAHDVGRAINPMLVEGQIEGGVAQGIGMALMEDYQPGRTENLHDYLIPTIGDMPEFTNIIIEVEDAEGPYGAKGLGEHVLIPTAPAIVNAIRHATGAVVRDLPATPDKVLAAISATGRSPL